MVLQILSTLQNIDIFILGIASAAIFILGFIVFLTNKQNITNQSFLLFSIFTVLWSTFNFLITQFSSPTVVLWLLRFSVFFATWHAFSFFQLFYAFPAEHVSFSKKYKYIFIPLLVSTSYLTLLTPFVFTNVAEFSSGGQVSRVNNGPGIVLFAFTVGYFVLGGLFLLFSKVFQASDEQKNQFLLVLIGSIITFTLLIIFNFLLPAFFDNARFVSFGAVFILPFIIFTAYAIIKHHLLNIKVIGTEVLTFALAIATLFEVVISENIGILIFRLSTFLLVLSLGILLIRSVRREVEQREELQDLTYKLERANEELKRLDKAKSEFVSIASHQLRTPLTAIKGYLSLVLEGTYGVVHEKMQRPLHSVYESNERLIRLVNDLLSLSRIESGKMKLEPETVQITKVVQSVVNELQIKTQQKNLKLLFEEPKPAIPPLQLDKEKISNVILNLIDNAIRYTKKGRITVKLEIRNPKSEKKLLISVTDTGAGMTKEEVSKLFESFSRGQTGAKLSTEGAGLGLYIARQFVHMHGGRIWAESAGKGKGSTFIVEIPVQSNSRLLSRKKHIDQFIGGF